MITLAFEIYFGMRAFKNGWRYRVFIPVALMLLTSFALGFISGLGGSDGTEMLPATLLLELSLIVVLRYMANHPHPYSAEVPSIVSRELADPPTA